MGRGEGKERVGNGTPRSVQVDEKIEKRQTANSDDFVEWIPNNQKTSVVEVSPTGGPAVFFLGKEINIWSLARPTKPDYESSCTFVANTTALKGIFQRLATQFGAMCVFSGSSNAPRLFRRE